MNARYNGSRAAAWFTVLLGLLWIGPGLVHSFLPDGGAEAMTGIDTSQNVNLIVTMFAWAGATQLVHGMLLTAIGLWYRPLVPLALLLSLIERSLLSLSAWVRHVPVTGQHPPEHYGNAIAVPLIFIFLLLSLRDARRM
jgi:hypothetical protein